jgi:N-acetylmuramate 1-kinase
MQNDSRLVQGERWLRGDLGLRVLQLAPASADASFRRYFRVWLQDGQTRVLMDAPPDKEDLTTYLKVSHLLADCSVHVPAVDAADLLQGYCLLEDLGSTPMLSVLNAGADAEKLYQDALGTLAALQLAAGAAATQLPDYDEAALRREMQLLPEWFCEKHLQLILSETERQVVSQAFTLLVRECLAQPRVFVHRDYHSRNLMLTAERSPGVIDFQDALHGPVGYDLVSILKDCYIAWPRAQVERWVGEFRQRLLAGGSLGRRLAGDTPMQFLRWFDMAGLQRHLKVLGIFARLYWRDGKAGYLADLPRTLDYVREVTGLYPEFAAFHALVEQRFTPNLERANQRALAAK